jgi:hypothetical protein
LQRKIYKLSSDQKNTGDFDWNYLNRIYTEWNNWGLVALITPVAALIMMVLKIPH